MESAETHPDQLLIDEQQVRGMPQIPGFGKGLAKLPDADQAPRRSPLHRPLFTASQAGFVQHGAARSMFELVR